MYIMKKSKILLSLAIVSAFYIYPYQSQAGMSEIINIQNSEDNELLLDQYRILMDTLYKINDLREKSNDFWVGMNSGLIGIFSYFRSTQFPLDVHHSLFLWTLLIIGFVLCYTWLSSILIVKKRIDILNCMLIEIERYLPAKLFTVFILKTGRTKGKNSLTLKESIVPVLFLIGYSMCALILYSHPHFLFKI